MPGVRTEELYSSGAAEQRRLGDQGLKWQVWGGMRMEKSVLKSQY